MIALPLFYSASIDSRVNDCCNDSATFSPEHQLSIYFLVTVCIITYFYSRYSKAVKSPVLEVLINAVLLLAIIFNVFMSIQVEQPIWLFGNLPICMLFTMQLIENQKTFVHLHQSNVTGVTTSVEKIAWRILTLKPILKFPILLLLCLPILTIIMILLLVFGQKPDSFIRAFTDTYKHGFSQLDHLCDNVDCGGHFLCSVAAGGHGEFVKPIRYGERGGNKIICNRQLLIANAFEEWVEEKFPGIHKMIRRNYNKVGDVIHRYYFVFNKKWIADLVYILMKPLELFFLLILYTFDQQPENRIAQQYLSKSDRQQLKEKNKFLLLRNIPQDHLYMKILFVAIFTFFNLIANAQDLEKKLNKVKTVAEGNKFVTDNPLLNAEVIEFKSDMDSSALAKKIVDGELHSIVNMDGFNYKIIGINITTSLRTSYIYLDGSKLAQSKIDSLRKVIIAQYSNGKSFPELAKEYNMDGNPTCDLGWFSEGMMVKAFSAAVKEHKKGDIFTIDIPENKWYYVTLKTFDNKEEKVYTALKIKNVQ